MPPATEQPRKRKRGDQAPKIRFLNMSTEQTRRRYKKVKQRQYRKAQQRIKRRRPPSRADSSPTVRSGLKRKNAVRKGRPCCGLRVQNCKCKAPPGMRKSHLNALARRFGRTALSSFRDTTDVSTFQRLMAKRKRSKTLPLGVLLAYAHTHVVFNQDHLLRDFIERKAFLFKKPWFDWKLLQSIVKKSKQSGQRFRSSNFRSTSLRKILLPSHIGKARLLQSSDDTVERAVLACKLVGEDAMPAACLALYDNNPSRDLWKASMLTWLEQVHSICSGCFNQYYLKCCLDRAFAVRTFDPATISWWPPECPAYRHWYKLLYPDRSLTTEEKIQVLCTTYITLNRVHNCSIPEALAQTCWVKKERNGHLHVDDNN